MLETLYTLFFLATEFSGTGGRCQKLLPLSWYHCTNYTEGKPLLICTIAIIRILVGSVVHSHLAVSPSGIVKNGDSYHALVAFR